MSEVRQLPARLDLVRTKGDAFNVKFTITNSSGPVDITGWTLTGTGCGVTVDNATAGVLTVTPTRTDGAGVWQLIREAPNTRTLVAGVDRVSAQTDQAQTAGEFTLQVAEADETLLTISGVTSTLGRVATAELLVETAEDLPDPVAGEHVLPADTLVRFSGTVDLGVNALRLSAGTVINSHAHGTVVSSAAGGVLRATGLASAVLVRETNIVATAGPCLNLSGPADQQCNLFFVGLFGVTAGTITGFDVQSIKACYIDATDGITFAGTTSKVFVHETPFYSITGTAIRLAANLNATVVDLVTSFFKFDSPGVAVEAVAGYTVGDGVLRGSLVDGTAVPLDGLNPEDLNWRMHGNTGVRDSWIAGQASLTVPVTVTITTAGTFVQVQDTFALAAVSERFALVGSELQYVGRYPALVDFNSSFTVDPANNNRIAFRATKNGVPIAESETVVEQGAGPGSSPRAGSVVAIQRLVTGDKVGIAAANLEGTADFTVQRCTFAVRGS